MRESVETGLFRMRNARLVSDSGRENQISRLPEGWATGGRFGDGAVPGEYQGSRVEDREILGQRRRCLQRRHPRREGARRGRVEKNEAKHKRRCKVQRMRRGKETVHPARRARAAQAPNVRLLVR